jgi:uncharacterized membrane protein SpoIIM required for sporulation
MRLEEFESSRRQRWEELAQATKIAASGRFRLMSVADIERMDSLYRMASSDLAIASRDFPDDNITLYLNGLCARAYALLHPGNVPHSRDIWGFFARTFPQTFRRNIKFFWASLTLTLASAVAGWIAVYTRPDLRSLLVPSSLFNELAQGQHPATPPSGLISSLVITNNIKVDLILFAGGLLAGTFTGFILAANGWMLGTIGAAVHLGHYDAVFWSYIVPHGAIELSVIVIAGGAGLALGNAILRPGLRSRSDALASAGIDSFRLALGVAALLCVAGFFEGFVSPSSLPVGVKYAIGAVNFIWLYYWLIRAGRKPPNSTPTPQLSLARPYSRLRLGG